MSDQENTDKLHTQAEMLITLQELVLKQQRDITSLRDQIDILRELIYSLNRKIDLIRK